MSDGNRAKASGEPYVNSDTAADDEDDDDEGRIAAKPSSHGDCNLKLFLLCYSVYVLVIAAVARWVNGNVAEPYMDEIFHVPQAQKYCAGDFRHWDPHITTPPGLYLVSLVLLSPVRIAVATVLLDVDWCSVFSLRLMNSLLMSLLPLVCLFGIIHVRVYLRSSEYRDVKGRRKSADSQWITIEDVCGSFAIALNPILFFTSFLYYTDVASTLLLLLFMQAHARSQRRLAFVLFLASLLCRQDNIVWALLPISMASCRSATTFLWNPTMSVDAILMAFLVSVWRAFEYILIVASFVFILITNRGLLSLGHHQFHQTVFHLPQLFYLACFLVVLSWPRMALFLHRKLRHPYVRSCSTLCVLKMVAISVVIFVGIHYFTFEHPFLVSDNRHVAFYIWARFFRRRAILKYLYGPFYFAALMYLDASFQDKTVLVSYGLPAALSVIPHGLLEPRYFIPAYSIYRMLATAVASNAVSMDRKPASVDITKPACMDSHNAFRLQPPWSLLIPVAELATAVALNAWILYMFAERPLYRSTNDGSLARLMW